MPILSQLLPILSRALLILAASTPMAKKISGREAVVGGVSPAIVSGKEKLGGVEAKTEKPTTLISPTVITSDTKRSSTPTQAPKTPDTRVSSAVITSVLPGNTTPSETARITPSKIVEQPQISAPSPVVSGATTPTARVETERVVPSAPTPTITPSASVPTETGKGIVPGFIPTSGGGIPVPPSPVKEIPAVPISQVIEQVLRGEKKPTAEIPIPEPIEERGRQRPKRIEEILSELIK